jgi:peptidoglycan/xylan/chitin deacetylase (PgdA/CDA1 family)
VDTGTTSAAAAPAAAAAPTTTSRSRSPATSSVGSPSGARGGTHARLARRGFWLAAALLAIAGAVAGMSEARAGRWPQPAAGSSASGAPEIIFTFDDGPHRKYTATILDELDRRGIKAIFFWVGHRVTRGGGMEEQISLVHRAVREGHLIANHTIDHTNLCQVKRDEAAREIDDNRRIYEQLSGLPIILFRSPYGARCNQLVSMLEERSMQHMHWDIDPQEWEHHSAERVAEYMIRKLKYLDGRAIVLMHDTKPASAKALPEVLDWIEKENQRRIEKGGKLPIRILSGSDLLAERVDPALPHWIEQSSERTVAVFTTALGRLIP